MAFYLSERNKNTKVSQWSRNSYMICPSSLISPLPPSPFIILSTHWSFCCSMYSPSIFLLQDICNCWSLPRKLFPSILMAHFFPSFMSLLKWHIVKNAFPDHSMRWHFLTLAFHVHLMCLRATLLQSCPTLRPYVP